jgi:hypothetical protein
VVATVACQFELCANYTLDIYSQLSSMGPQFGSPGSLSDCKRSKIIALLGVVKTMPIQVMHVEEGIMPIQYRLLQTIRALQIESEQQPIEERNHLTAPRNTSGEDKIIVCRTSKCPYQDRVGIPPST